MNVLHSKLQTPKRYDILQRGRLIQYFDNIHQKKLTTVTAGAGYGKTTLVMDALASHEFASIWYRLDEQDTDFLVFISYLYSAIGQTIPKSNLTKQTDTLLEWLCLLEKTILHQTVIIFDDYHLVQDNQQINQAIEFILDRLPAHIHLVIIGRKNLNLKLSVLRTRELLMEISETDLTFTPEEIKLFFTNSQVLNNTHIQDIHSSTGGWVASLVLLKYTFNKKIPGAVSKNLKLIKQTPEYVFSYLKETIFDTQPDHIKTFMMKAALLTEIDTGYCNKIFDMDNAQSISNQMIQDHLMIFPVDESGTLFYLHHLFKDFLITQLEKTFSSSQIQQLHCKIAQQIEADDIFQALHHYIEGHAFDDAIQLVKTHEMKILLEGKMNFFSQCLKKIPKAVIEQNPQLLLAQARLYSNFGDPRQAMEKLTRAHLLFKKQNAKENMVTCLIELGTQYYLTGHLKEAKLLMEQVLDDIKPTSSTYIITMTFLTFLSAVLGEYKTAESHFNAAWEQIENFPDFERRFSTAAINTSYSHTLYFKGEFETSQKFNAKLLKSVLELNFELCLPLVYYQISATSFYSGKFEKGFDAGQKGIEICEKLSLLDSRKAWNYLAWAQNCIGLGKLEHAAELIDNSIELFEDPGNRWGMASALECQHLIYLAQGKPAPARKILNRAIDIIDGYGLLPTEGMLENSLANLLIINKEHAAALNCLKNARPKLDGTQYHLFNNHLLTAKTLFELDQRQRATDHLSSALTLAQNNTYDRFVIKEKEWLIPIIKDLLSKKTAQNKIPIPYIKTLFQDDLANPPALLKIKLLGQFKLTIDNQNIPLSQWKSSKALMILKYLAANRQKGFIPREVLIEMLWPEQDMQKTSSRFNMAMSALRKTLEPQLAPKAPSLYIERKKDMYALYQDTRINIDVEVFAQTIAIAQKEESTSKKGLATYLTALSIYKGKFLAEDLYEEWCIQQREQFSTDYLKMLKEIIAIYEAQKDLEKSIFYTKEILTANPYDEGAFKRLMIFFSQSGNLSRLKQTYSDYKKMTRQIDCPISDEIKNMYHDLTSI